jgi:hypothetical protein
MDPGKRGHHAMSPAPYSARPTTVAMHSSSTGPKVGRTGLSSTRCCGSSRSSPARARSRTPRFRSRLCVPTLRPCRAVFPCPAANFGRGPTSAFHRSSLQRGPRLSLCIAPFPRSLPLVGGGPAGSTPGSLPAPAPPAEPIGGTHQPRRTVPQPPRAMPETEGGGWQPGGTTPQPPDAAHQTATAGALGRPPDDPGAGSGEIVGSFGRGRIRAVLPSDFQTVVDFNWRCMTVQSFTAARSTRIACVSPSVISLRRRSFATMAMTAHVGN